MEELSAKYPALAEISLTDEQMKAVAGGLKKIGESKGEKEITVDDLKNVLTNAKVEVSEEACAEINKLFVEVKSGKISEKDLEKITGGVSDKTKKNLKKTGKYTGIGALIVAVIGGGFCMIKKVFGGGYEQEELSDDVFKYFYNDLNV